MNITKYLERIGLTDTDIKLDLNSLRRLHRAHLLAIPFENLDIHWKRPIVLDTEKFYEKIVGEDRGGFCYEQNGLFHEVLKVLGFENRIVSSRVDMGDGTITPEYDHMALIAVAEGQEYLVDVGFGRGFATEPLKLLLDLEQQDPSGIFRIREHNDGYLLVERKDDDGGWCGEYIFKRQVRDLSEFSGMCHFHQTSPESHFTKDKICSQLSEEGRKTLTGKKYVETKNGERTEMDVESEQQFNEILKREFNIKVPN